MEEWISWMISAAVALVITRVCYSLKLRKIVRDNEALIDALQRQIPSADVNNIIDAAQEIASREPTD